jgi:hypothetical protein
MVKVDIINGGGGYTRPIPIDTVPTTTVGIDIGAATAYRDYYYEIVKNLAGDWLWAVYIGTRVSWGLSGVLISGGTSATKAEALAQVTTIIDNLSTDEDYIAPDIQDDASIELEDVPELDLGGAFGTPTDIPIITGNGNGNGNGDGNGNGNGLEGEYAFIGLIALAGLAWLLFSKEGAAVSGD